MQIFYELLEEYKVRYLSLKRMTNHGISSFLKQVRGVDLFITHLKNKPQRQFMQAGIWDLLGADAFRQTVADAISIVEASNQ